jgi:hypothetical protein
MRTSALSALSIGAASALLAACGSQPWVGVPAAKPQSRAVPTVVVRVDPRKIVFPSPRAPTRVVSVRNAGGGMIYDDCDNDHIATVWLKKRHVTLYSYRVKPLARGHCFVLFGDKTWGKMGTLHVIVQ